MAVKCLQNVSIQQWNTFVAGEVYTDLPVCVVEELRTHHADCFEFGDAPVAAVEKQAADPPENKMDKRGRRIKTV